MESLRGKKDALVVWTRGLRVAPIAIALRVARLANAAVAVASAVSPARQLPTFPATRKKVESVGVEVVEKKPAYKIWKQQFEFRLEQACRQRRNSRIQRKGV
jgi:hypothetical protein